MHFIGSWANAETMIFMSINCYIQTGCSRPGPISIFHYLDDFQEVSRPADVTFPFENRLEKDEDLILINLMTSDATWRITAVLGWSTLPSKYTQNYAYSVSLLLITTLDWIAPAPWTNMWSPCPLQPTFRTCPKPAVTTLQQKSILFLPDGKISDIVRAVWC